MKVTIFWQRTAFIAGLMLMVLSKNASAGVGDVYFCTENHSNKIFNKKVDFLGYHVDETYTIKWDDGELKVKGSMYERAPIKIVSETASEVIARTDHFGTMGSSVGWSETWTISEGKRKIEFSYVSSSFGLVVALGTCEKFA